MPTKIEWTGETWNPVRARLLANPARVGWHCTHASSGCIRCYAERMNLRGIGTGLAYKPGNEKLIEIFLDETVLRRPLAWKRPRFIFPGSMTDLAADFMEDEWIERIFAIPALAPQHTFQFLTKRPDRWGRFFAGIPECPDSPKTRWAMIDGQAQAIYSAMNGGEDPSMWLAVHDLPNVWLGTSVEDGRVRHRIDALREIPAAKRWLSIEPMIGPLPDLNLKGIAWVVVGGESGSGARPMHPAWPRSIRDQCAAAGVPFFFKQWGNWRPCCALDRRAMGISLGGAIRSFDGIPPREGEEAMIRVNSKADAGRLLDGDLHDGMPS